jgi:hypothetical protein
VSQLCIFTFFFFFPVVSDGEDICGMLGRLGRDEMAKECWELVQSVVPVRDKGDLFKEQMARLCLQQQEEDEREEKEEEKEEEEKEEEEEIEKKEIEQVMHLPQEMPQQDLGEVWEVLEEKKRVRRQQVLLQHEMDQLDIRLELLLKKRVK